MVHITNTQQISWFLDLNSRRLLNLDPPYQRYSVWSISDQEYFLETIFKNYPCPALFLNHRIDDEGVSIYSIIDGKQRLQTIIDFNNNDLCIPREFADKNLAGKKFNELSIEQKKDFWQYSLVIEQIDSVESDVISEMFDRFNRNAHNLNQQELRHAKYSGWFITESTLTSNDKFWTEVKVSSIQKARRMKDVQFISELLIMTIGKTNYGFHPDHIDEMYAKYDNLNNVPDFILDDYRENKTRVIEYIKQLLNADDKELIKFISLGYNFYTLWNWILLNEELPNPNEFVRKYLHFISKVNYYKSNKDDVSQNVDQMDPIWLYFKHSIGATTDHGLRIGRYNALKDYLKNDNT